MKPSVKFVSPNEGLISKTNRGQFFLGGLRGVWQKTILFTGFFSDPFSKFFFFFTTLQILKSSNLFHVLNQTGGGLVLKF